LETYGSGHVKFVEQKYGGDHEDKDTWSHFQNGTELESEEGSRKFVGQKYGGDHEDKDTWSHFQNGTELQSEEGSSKFVGQKYGGEFEHMDTFSHLGAGTAPIMGPHQPPLRCVDANGPTPGAKPKQIKLFYPGRYDLNGTKGLPLIGGMPGARLESRGYPDKYTKFTGGISMNGLRATSVIIQPSPSRPPGMSIGGAGYRKATVSKEYLNQINFNADMIFNAYTAGKSATSTSLV
jgi:hypothetical protein